MSRTGARKPLIIRFLNVGQGDATHLILPTGEHVLIDVNLDHKNRGLDVIQYLADELPEGDEQSVLAYFVATHPHEDHIRGAGALGHDFEIGEMWHSGHELDVDEGENDAYDKYVALIDDLGDRAVAVVAGSEPWAIIGDVTFHVFRPSAYVKPDRDKTSEEKREAIHNECMVVKVSYAGRAVMFSGDAHRGAWESIVKHYDRDGLLDADVLHASHHGSRTFFRKSKDGEAWTGHMDAIAPDHVVISVGADNPHAHPHADAMKLYRQSVAAANIYRTDERLTVELTIHEDGTMSWAMDDQDLQDQYELPDPDDSRASKATSAAIISKTRLGDKSPTA